MDRPSLTYLHWEETQTQDLSPASLNALYENGFVATRKEKGVFHQTRSVRINLSQFTPSSENRRMLKKGEEIILESHPIPYASYDWKIGKMAKDFYDRKAGASTFSANKLKSILTDINHTHFNTLLVFKKDTEVLGYCVCVQTPTLLHYCYPFYSLTSAPKDMGLIMMTKTLVWAQENKLSHVYLGSLQRPSDVYKLQFTGMQWFDGKEWKTDLEEVKRVLKGE